MILARGLLAKVDRQYKPDRQGVLYAGSAHTQHRENAAARVISFFDCIPAYQAYFVAKKPTEPKPR